MTALARSLAGLFRRDPGALFAPSSRAIRQIEAGEDIYRILGAPTRSVLRTLRARFGQELVDAFELLDRTYSLTPELVEHFAEWLVRGQTFGTYAELSALRRTAGVADAGTFLHADHIIEQRIHRMVRDGAEAHAVRAPGVAQAERTAQEALERPFEHLGGRVVIDDGLSVLVPANEVASYRLSRALREATGAEHAAAWFYPHLGHNSKTSLLAQWLPWRLEGAYTYQEMLDATLWVMHRHFGVPTGGTSLTRGPIVEAIRTDLAESILDAARHDPEIARYVVAEIRSRTGRRLSVDGDAIEDAIVSLLDARVPALELPTTWRWQNPLIEWPEVQFELAEDLRGLAGRATSADYR